MPMSSAPVNGNLSVIFPDASLRYAQRKVTNGLVNEVDRTKFNLALPPRLMEELNEVASRYGSGRKWMVLSAAVAAFLSLDKAQQDDWVERVSAADLRRDYGALLNHVPKKSTNATKPRG